MSNAEPIRDAAVESSIATARRDLWWLLAILLLGAGLRLFRLGTYPFWHDEVHDLIKAENWRGVLFRGEFVSNHPPLFSLMGGLWRAMGMADTEWTARLLTVLLGLGVIVAAYIAGRRLFDGRAGLIAAFLVAVSPYFVLHSQDYKVYILLPMTGTLLAWSLYNAVEYNTAFYWVVYAIFAAAACYSDVWSAPLLIGLNIWFLLQLRGRINRLPGCIFANMAGVGAFIPYLQFILHRADLMLVKPDLWWIPSPTMLSILFYLKTVAFGYSDWEPFFKVAMVLFGLAAAAGVIVAFYKSWRVALLVICWFVLPIAVVYAGSQFINSFFLIRALIPFAIPVYLLVGAAIGAVKPWPVRAGAIVLFGALAAPSLWKYYQRELPVEEFPHRPGIHFPADYDLGAQQVATHWQEGDVVIHSAASSWLPFFHYGLKEKRQIQAGVGDAHVEHVYNMAPPTQDREEHKGYFPHEINQAVQGAKRIWFVFSDWERQYLPDNPMLVWRWLDAHYTEVAFWNYRGFELRLYETGEARPRVVRRDSDDGASAVVYRSDGEGPYQKLVPDSGMMPTDVSERVGALVLRFADEGGGERVGAPQTEARRDQSFEVMNTSSSPSDMSIHVLASDALIEPASLDRVEPDLDAWRVVPHHNPEGEPPIYGLSVAGVMLDGTETASLGGTMELPPGHYETVVYFLGTSLDQEHLRASIDFTVNSTDVLARAPKNRPDWFAWHWMRGAAVTIGADSPSLRFTAGPVIGREHSYGDVGYVGFIRERGEPRPVEEGAFVAMTPGEVTLAPGASKHFTVSIDADMPRIDVWVFEHGRDGRAYRIFDVRDAAVMTTN